MQPDQPQQIDGVFGVDINWKIQFDAKDLGNVMKPEDCRFTGTQKECSDFIECWEKIKEKNKKF